MEDRRYHTRLASQTEAHVNIANLCNGRKGNHSHNVVFADCVQGTDNHTQYTEHKKDIDNFTVYKGIETDDSVNDFYNKEYISLGYQT